MFASQTSTRPTCYTGWGGNVDVDTLHKVRDIGLGHGLGIDWVGIVMCTHKDQSLTWLHGMM